MRRALTIAGSDSGGGAGIQADLKVFTAFGVYGMSVVTAITAQNTVRISGIHGLPAQFVRLQLEAVLEDIGSDGIKTGMLLNADIVETVADSVRQYAVPFWVIDPVMVSKGGDRLLDERAVQILVKKCIPLCSLVTPNIPEAEVLAGIRIDTENDIFRAAKKIHRLGAGAVLIKGGHRPGNATDILFDGKEFTRFVSEMIPTKNTHGTGCTYSAAILANLILGRPLEAAVRISKAYVTEAIRQAFPIGKGYGPLNHFIRPESV